MSRHAEMLDDLEARLRHPDFARMIGGAGPAVTRASPERLSVDASGTAAGLVISVSPLDPAEAPDESPRLVLESTRGATKHADRSVDGLVMGVVSLVLDARQRPV